MRLPLFKEGGVRGARSPIHFFWRRRRFWALALAGLILSGALLSFVPLWTTSPPHFRPVIRISVVDWLQSRALARAAGKAMEKRDWDQALMCWHTAAAKNAGSTNVLAGAVRAFGLMPQERIPKDRMRGQGEWLLRLAKTNGWSIEQVLPGWRQAGDWQAIFQLLQGRERRELLEEVSFFESAVRLGRGERVVGNRDEWPQWAEYAPGLVLCQLAAVAGWGSKEERPGALRELRAIEVPVEREQERAALLLQVARATADRELAEDVVEGMQAAGGAGLNAVLVLAELLVEEGDLFEAARVLGGQREGAGTVHEALLMARLWSGCGRNDLALNTLESARQQFPGSASPWLAEADLLEEEEEWERLRQLAVQMRLSRRVRLSLGSYSYYVEAVALNGMGRRQLGGAMARRLLESGVGQAGLAMRIGRGLRQMGEWEVGVGFMSAHEELCAGDPGYWAELFALAHAVKDLERMQEAARRGVELLPSDPVMVSNYAAVLLIRRNGAEPASYWTFALLNYMPNSVIARIQHAGALALAGRAVEAEKLLQEVERKRLRQEAAVAYDLHWMDISLQLGRYEEARQVLERIDPAALYAPQRQWLAEVRQELERLDRVGPISNKGRDEANNEAGTI